MREIRDLHVEQSRKGFLKRLVPRPHPNTGKPFVMLEGERQVWFEEGLKSGREHLCWIFPTSRSGDYYALPIGYIDTLHGICLLNTCMQIREGRPGYEEAVEAMQKVLDGLEETRPDKILCAEGEFASKHVRKFLIAEGFRMGRPQVALDSICYLGTFPGQDGRFLAQGIGGRVLVDGLAENYVGPMYVSCDVTRAGNGNQGGEKTYKAFALPKIDGHLRDRLWRRYFQKDKSSDDAVDEKVRQILGA